MMDANFYLLFNNCDKEDDSTNSGLRHRKTCRQTDIQNTEVTKRHYVYFNYGIKDELLQKGRNAFKIQQPPCKK